LYQPVPGRRTVCGRLVPVEKAALSHDRPHVSCDADANKSQSGGVEKAEMTIRFACQCGKRLQAPERMAGRTKKCPACGYSVEVPLGRFGRLFRGKGRGSSKRDATRRPKPERVEQPPPVDPAGSSAAAEVGPFKTADERPIVSTFVPTRAVTAGFDPEAVSIAIRRPPRWTRLLSNRVEPRWYHSLTFPISNVPIFFKLAIMLTVLTAFALGGWLSIDHDRPANWAYGMLGIALVLLLFVLGRTLNYFNAVLALAAQGKVKHEASIDFDPIGALLGCGQWLACFLAGPAILFGSALGYWLYCGDLSVIDWLILAELAFVGIGWWLIAILLTNVDGGLRVAMPRQVIRMAWGMGWKTIELTALGSAVFVAHLFTGTYGIGHLHDQPVTSFALLCVAATTGLYLAAFTFRRLGLAYCRYKRRVSTAVEPRETNVVRTVQNVTDM
jgi:hypothetical protein